MTAPSELLGRLPVDLRARAARALSTGNTGLADLLDDAADEIDRVRRDRDRLRAEVDSYIVEIEQLRERS